MLRLRSLRAFSTTPAHVTSTMKGKTAWIVMDRPNLNNAFDDTMISQLRDAFKQVPSEARCVVLTGMGKSFSAGADLNWMKRMAAYTEQQNKQDSEALFDMFHAIQSCPVPVIGRVNGAALGGGAGLVASCDFAVSVDTALFGFTECKLGLIPAVISPFVMAKIGKGNALRYFLTAERFAAPEATRIGLVQSAVTGEEALDAAVAKLTGEIEQNSPAAVRACKALIATVAGADSDPFNKRDYVTNQIARIRVSPEGQEGLNAFLNKRKPAWLTN